MRHFLLLVIVSLLPCAAAAQSTYGQLMDQAGAQMSQKNYCAAAATFEQAFADSTQAGPFDLFAGGMAAAQCPGREPLALRWLLRLPRLPNLPITGRDVENMAAEPALTSLRAYPQWNVFLTRLRAVAAQRDEETKQAATAWVRAAEGRALSAARSGRFVTPQLGFALYYAQVDTVRVPYLVYVPRSYQPRKPTALLVYLHGGVANTTQFQHRDPRVSQEPIFAVADSLNAVVPYPFGRKSFGWLEQPAALENVLAMIAATQARYRLDKRRVYLGGLSNGGTAAYWYATERPIGFAGFYALSATPSSQLGPLNWRRLAQGPPIYSLHAEDDDVFPYKDVRAVYEQQRAVARQWHFNSRPTGGHDFIYGPQGQQILLEFLAQVMTPMKIKK